MARIEGELPDLSKHHRTGYAPYPLSPECHGVVPLAKVNVERGRLNDHESNYGCAWTRCYRVTDFPRLVAECREAGVDPEGAYITIFDGPFMTRMWVKTAAETDALRFHWARKHNVTDISAAEHVGSPYIGRDQRLMYQAVLRAL